jgi:hypothetical protein
MTITFGLALLTHRSLRIANHHAQETNNFLGMTRKKSLIRAEPNSVSSLVIRQRKHQPTEQEFWIDQNFLGLVPISDPLHLYLTHHSIKILSTTTTV